LKSLPKVRLPVSKTAS